jgi:biopolymer transport protein ExbB/TolQ
MGEKREFAGWWMWILLLLVISAIVFTGLRYVGLVGQTMIERKVFEESYQRSAGDEAKLNTFRASMAEIESQLRRDDLSASTRADYEAQLAAIRIQINALEN